jgi:hypothetical protein
MQTDFCISDLRPAGVNFIVSLLQHGDYVLEAQAGLRVTIGIGDDSHSESKPLEHARLFQTAHMTAIAGEEAGGGKHEHAQNTLAA